MVNKIINEEKDIKNFQLNDFDFDNIEELYLDDEEESFRFTFEV